MRLRSAPTVAISQGATTALGSLSAFALAFLLGPSERGGLALLQSIAALVASVGLIGVPTLVVRRRVIGLPNELLFAAGACAVLASAAVGVTCSVLYGMFEKTGLGQGHVSTAALYAVGLVAALQVTVELLVALLQAQSQFIILAALRLALAVVSTSALLLAALSYRNPSAIFFGVAIGACLNLFVALMFTRRYRLGRSAIRVIRSIYLQLSDLKRAVSTDPQVRSALTTHFSLLLLLLVYRLDVLLLSAISTPAEVGVYAVAYTIAEAAWLLVNGYAITLLPRLVRSDSLEKSVLASATTRSVLTALLTLVLLIIGANFVLIPVLGEGYARVIPSLLCLFPGVLLFIPFKLRVTYWIAKGEPRQLWSACLKLLILNVVANLLLDKRYGAVGASLASSLTYCAAFFLYRSDTQNKHASPPSREDPS